MKEVSQRRNRERKKADKGEGERRGSPRMCAEFELEIGNRMSACFNMAAKTTEPLQVQIDLKILLFPS